MQEDLGILIHEGDKKQKNTNQQRLQPLNKDENASSKSQEILNDLYFDKIKSLTLKLNKREYLEKEFEKFEESHCSNFFMGFHGYLKNKTTAHTWMISVCPESQKSKKYPMLGVKALEKFLKKAKRC